MASETQPGSSNTGRDSVNESLAYLQRMQGELIEKRARLSKDGAPSDRFNYPGVDDWAIQRLAAAISALVTKQEGDRR